MTPRKARMAHDGHREFAPASRERALDPSPLAFIDRAQYSGIDRQQREILGLQLEEWRSLGTDIDAI